MISLKNQREVKTRTALDWATIQENLWFRNKYKVLFMFTFLCIDLTLFLG